jgi:hypothetical protein
VLDWLLVCRFRNLRRLLDSILRHFCFHVRFDGGFTRHIRFESFHIGLLRRRLVFHLSLVANAREQTKLLFVVEAALEDVEEPLVGFAQNERYTGVLEVLVHADAIQLILSKAIIFG